MTTTNGSRKSTTAGPKTAKTRQSTKTGASNGASRSSTTKPVEVEPAATEERDGPVLGAYRLGLSGLQMVTVGVGGAALGSLGRLGIPKGAAEKMKGTHAGAVRKVTSVSDTVGTKAAKVVGKTVSAGSSAAKYLFP